MKHLKEPIKFSMTTSTKIKNVNPKSAYCAFWNSSLSAWRTDGCKNTGLKLNSGQVTIDCECDHLTDFGVLFDPDAKVSPMWIQILSTVSVGLSLTGTIITLVLHLTIPHLHKRVPQKIFIHLCIALTGLYVTFFIGMMVLKPETKSGCLTTAVLLHYFTISSATWTACQAIHLSHQPLFTNKLRSSIGVLSENGNAFVKRAAVFCHLWPPAIVLANLQIISGRFGRKYLFNSIDDVEDTENGYLHALAPSENVQWVCL